MLIITRLIVCKFLYCVFSGILGAFATIHSDTVMCSWVLGNFMNEKKNSQHIKK
jgi:hypothetical protein